VVRFSSRRAMCSRDVAYAEDEIVAEAEAGIADAEAGCFITVSSSGDAEALHEPTMARLRDRLASDQG
jgi:hypothetical protein